MSVTQLPQPESTEESLLRSRMEELRDNLALATTELEDLRSQLAAFEVRYDSRIGELLIALDRVTLQIAEYRERLRQLDDSIDSWSEIEARVSERFRADWARLEADENDVRDASDAASSLPPVPSEDRMQELRHVYHRLAKEHHPDLATNDHQRQRNEDTMRRINAAFDAHDLETLRYLEIELPVDERNTPGASAAASVAWLIAQIARVEEALVNVLAEVARLKSSQLHQLWLRCEEDPSLMTRLEYAYRRDVRTRQSELDDLILQYKTSTNERFSQSDSS